MRAAARREPVGVALFPFLAVLICTMGALIVLLVLLVQQARVDAQTISQSKEFAAATDAKTKEQLEDIQWRSELLQQSRTEKTKELADSRDKLSHLEEHIRRLETQAKELLQRAKSIDEGRQLRGDEQAAARAELARLQAEIERKKAELESAQKQQSSDQWYALIPYDGPHGTRRRPIYLECTELGVVIQPEGVLLGNADFEGPGGPGNPLDAAVRTIRDHMQQTSGAKAGAAYPLLVVRPGGVEAYGAARDALQAWDDEFGYELISDDKQLDFGPPDPALAQALKGSLAAARKRQAVMAAMMPRRFQNPGTLTALQPEPSAMVGSAGASASGRGVGNGGGGSGTGLAGGTGGGLGDPLGKEPFGGAAAGGAGATGNSQAPANQPAGGHPGGQPSRQFGGQPAGTSAGSAPGAARGQGAGASGQAGGQAGAPAGKLQFGSPRPAGAANGGPSRAGTTSGFAAGRGNNWGLPGSRGRTTAVTRPVHVAVLGDRIVLVPDKGDNRLPQHLPISPELSPADVDRFVSAVQGEIRGWGLAVADGYWKPVLQFEVAPDAEGHFSNLQAALAGSGFEIERKGS